MITPSRVRRLHFRARVWFCRDRLRRDGRRCRVSNCRGQRLLEQIGEAPAGFVQFLPNNCRCPIGVGNAIRRKFFPCNAGCHE